MSGRRPHGDSCAAARDREANKPHSHDDFDALCHIGNSR